MRGPFTDLLRHLADAKYVVNYESLDMISRSRLLGRLIQVNEITLHCLSLFKTALRITRCADVTIFSRCLNIHWRTQVRVWEDHMVSAEREPIMGSGERAPSWLQGQSPCEAPDAESFLALTQPEKLAILS